MSPPTAKSKATRVKTEEPTLYWAYGSNLNVAHMRSRAPRAQKLRPLYAKQVQLNFRGVADVDLVRDENLVAAGGLWKITRDCEERLDKYEGVSTGVYEKRYFELMMGGKPVIVLFYTMKDKTGIAPPSDGYYRTILKGYRDFGLDPTLLKAALDRSWEKKNVTAYLHDRWVRRGRPNLMRLKKHTKLQTQEN